MQSAGLFIGGFHAPVTMVGSPSCGVKQCMGATRRKIHPSSSKAMQPLRRQRYLCDHDAGAAPMSDGGGPLGESLLSAGELTVRGGKRYPPWHGHCPLRLRDIVVSPKPHARICS